VSRHNHQRLADILAAADAITGEIRGHALGPRCGISRPVILRSPHQDQDNEEQIISSGYSRIRV
jgi:hypothetical protein